MGIKDDILLNPVSFEESGYEDKDGNYWYATTLKRTVEEQECVLFDFPLKAFDTSYLPFTLKNLDDFAYHMQRVIDCDTKYPIILGPYGGCYDGNHRLLKALIIEEKNSVGAYRLKYLPKPDKITNNGISI